MIVIPEFRYFLKLYFKSCFIFQEFQNFSIIQNDIKAIEFMQIQSQAAIQQKFAKQIANWNYQTNITDETVQSYAEV